MNDHVVLIAGGRVGYIAALETLPDSEICSVESFRRFTPELAAKMDQMSAAFYMTDEP